MEPFIFEHLDEQVDEYPIKIFFSNKGNFACLKVTIKRNMDNTKLIPNKQNSNKTLKVKIRKVLASIIKFAIQSNNHNCSTITHFSYYKTDMHSSINIFYPWRLSSATLKNEIMRLRSDDLINRLASACINNI